MNTQAGSTLDEIRNLISAQLDMLESTAPLTDDQLEELHNRAETIRMLCKKIGAEKREETTATESREPSVTRTRIRAHSLAA